MKAIFRKTLRIASIAALLTILIGAFTLAFPVSVVSAQGPEPQDTPTPTHERLERRYERAQNALEAQGNRLERTNDLVTRAEERISKRKEKGNDVTALETALQTFKDQVQVAKAEHQSAADVLAAHAGFDDQGSVTDAALARDTLQNAEQHLGAASRELRTAIRDLLRALRDFVRDNRK